MAAMERIRWTLIVVIEFTVSFSLFFLFRFLYFTHKRHSSSA